MISTRNLSSLPNVSTLRHLLQSLAILDAILSPELQYRYYSFDSRWANNEMLGSMRNGSGEHFFALFDSSGCFLKGFDHEAAMSPFRTDPPTVWPGVLDSVPNEFNKCLQEVAFVPEETTFCIWQSYVDNDWKIGEIDFPAISDPDGSEKLLSILKGMPQKYRLWASDYYEIIMPIELIVQIYQHQPLTENAIEHINPEASIDLILQEAEEIGYPIKLD